MLKNLIAAIFLAFATLAPLPSNAQTYHPPACSAAVVGARAVGEDKLLVVYHVTCDRPFRLYYQSTGGVMAIPKFEIARGDGPVKDINVSAIVPVKVLTSYALTIDKEKAF